MADLKHKDKREVSRDDAAERLIAIAGALRTGGTAELAAEGQGISVQVAGQVRREREYEMKGGRVELELELGGVPGAAVPAPNAPAAPASPPRAEIHPGSDRREVGRRRPRA